MNTPDQILTVLVLYEIKLEDSLAYQSLSHALECSGNKGQLFVYDNSATAQTLPENTPWEIQYYHDPANPGVSRAYNQAFVSAKRLHQKWLLFADQDTAFPENIFERYKNSMDIHPDSHVFAPILTDRKGIVSPFKPGAASGIRLQKLVAGKKLLNEIHAINSGLMIDLKIFELAGGYDERLPLDFSDFSFFKKLSLHTNHLVVVDAECAHELSSSEKLNLTVALKRFKIYLRGARIMRKGADAGFSFVFRPFLRAIKLSIHYRSVRFIGSLLSRQV